VSNANFLLEHFYYGQLVQDGKPGGNPLLLAASAGVTPDVAAQAVGRVTLPPLIRSATGAWALVRGRSRQMPFLLVQSQQGGAGQVMAHYIIATPDVLRSYGGNLKALMTVVENEMPVYTEIRSDPLPPVQLPPGEPSPPDVQIDDILELMTTTRNRINLIEPLLAAIVEGVQLVVQGAPPELEQRIAFVEGLLALLPSSARFGVTFTTHSLPSTDIDTQIRFYSDDLPPEDTVVFNWADGRVTGAELVNDYSRFVVSLLRLDASLIIERNTAMTAIAGWRLNLGDRLAAALSYASQRLRLDEALLNNQPVDKDEVARVLEEDPTLPTELRVLYARHLISFSLAMEDMSHAAPVATMLRANAELERSTLQQMSEALDEGQAWLIYDTLMSWISNPLGPEGTTWVDLTHRAALALVEELAQADDIDELNALLSQMQAAGPGVDLAHIAPRVIQAALPLAGADALLAENLFLLGIRYLHDSAFKRLLEDRNFRQQLSPQLNHVWAYITTDESHPPQPGLLAHAARGFGEQWEPAVLMRFAEIASSAGRVVLLDTPTLEALLQIALSPDSGRYAGRLLRIINTVSQALLTELEPPGPRYLLQIRLALGDYFELGRQMIVQSAMLYAGERQDEYLKSIEQVFGQTPVSGADVSNMLQAIYSSGVKSVPFAVAAAGALKEQAGLPELDQIAEQVVNQLYEERRLMEVVPPGTILALLAYFSRRRDLNGMTFTAGLVPLSAIHQGTRDTRMLAEAYKRMDWDDDARRVARHMLRVYIRQIGDEAGQRAMVFFGKQLGDAVRRSLEVTRIFKAFMSQGNLFDYAHSVAVVVTFLRDTAAFYASNRELPKTGTLSNEMDALPGGLTGQDRRALARRVLAMGQAIVELGQAYRAARSRDEDQRIARLLHGQEDPRGALDVLYVMGGYFAEGRRSQVNMSTASQQPLGDRSLQTLLDEVTAAADLLAPMVSAFPPGKPMRLSAADVIEEIESMWHGLENDDQRQVVRTLGVDFQRLASLVALIESEGDAKAMENSGLGKRIDSGRHRPHSALEFYRFIHGYYMTRS
jgi:hypothetical protein